MTPRLYLAVPLLAAMLYSVGALLMKSAERRGVGALRITVLANVAMAGMFLAGYPWAHPVMPEPFWPCLAVGVTFMLGQAFTILSFAHGQVSVATPALGTKVVLVAVIVWLFLGEPLAATTWIAAVAMLVGLVVLIGPRWRQVHASEGRAIVLALAAAISFAAFDVLVKVWSPRMGFWVLAPIGVTIGTLLSLPLARLRRSPSPAWPRETWLPLGIGALIHAGQSVLFIWFVGRFGEAARGNIVYGSRGIWGVIAVWALSHWLGHVERHQSRRVFLRRLAGAAIMAVAVALMFL